MNKTEVKKKITKTLCDSVKHTRFSKEDHLPNWARRHNKATKDYRVEYTKIQIMPVPVAAQFNNRYMEKEIPAVKVYP